MTDPYYTKTVTVDTDRQRFNGFNEKEMLGLMAMTGITVLAHHELANKYWPDAYVQQRLDSPWWLVKTYQGYIELGYRKRVFSISWHETPIKLIVTENDVTKSETMVHSYNIGDTIEHLKVLASRLNVNPEKNLWDKVGRLLEADARAGMMRGTTNWGAYLVKAIEANPS